MNNIKILPLGDTALSVEFGRVANSTSHQQVQALDQSLAKNPLEGVIELVPSYACLMLSYDPDKTQFNTLRAHIEKRINAPNQSVNQAKTRWVIPCSYSPRFAEDIAEAAALLGLSIDQLAQQHQSSEFQIALYGFAPGYAYLNGCPAALNLPRRAAPRPPTPENAIMIAGGQSLMAAAPMPTGWYVIGRCVESAFNIHQQPPVNYEVGDYLRFSAQSDADWLQLNQRAQNGEIIAYKEPR